MSRIIILGASSSIARSLAMRFAKDGASLFLAAREESEAARIAADVALRTEALACWSGFEATDYASHEALLDRATAELGGLDGVVLAFGNLGDEERARTDAAYARLLIEQNLTASVSLLTLAAQRLASQRSGFIVVLASVAGDRGRKANYVYGCAKAGLAVFAQGLRAYLNRFNVRVLTVKLGFVDTRMTYGRVPRLLAVSPEFAAERIHRAWRRRASEVYVPSFWRPIMAVVRAIPDSLFNRIEF